MATTSPQPSDNEPSSKKVKFSEDTEQSTIKDGDSVTSADLKTTTNTTAQRANDNNVKLSTEASAVTTNNKNSNNNNNNNSNSATNNNNNNNVKPNVGAGGDVEQQDVDDDDDDDADEGESSQEFDVDPKVKESLEEVEAIQNEIDNLNEKASDEILKVEQKYNKLRKPFFDKRNELLTNIPNFWIGTLVNNSTISSILVEEDEECLHYLTKIDVEEFDDIKSGFRLKFHFAPNNPYFTNDVLVKEFHSGDGTDEPTSKSTPINFKADYEPALRIKVAVEQELREQEDPANRRRYQQSLPRTFFSWFVHKSDSSSDEIAEIIKEELYQNPLQYYLLPDATAVEDSDDDDEEDDEPVLLGDDDEDDEDDDDDVGPEGEIPEDEDDGDDDDDDDDDGDDDVDDDDEE